MGKGTDIVIPVYNAYDDLRICLDSVYKYTDLHENRLILINDNSPDERIKIYLDGQQKENVIIIHNSENKGFSNNINIGIAQSKTRDVLLLNSDTVVTENWLEKIVKCAYSDGSIGTVTPLSNNATLCSVPNFCEENTLPEGMTIDQAAAIVEECSLKKYPRITVAHGFCMFVKREVINIIGNFDAETFGRGYGEENDFCNRAEQMGYIHVMCDDTYIYHSGTKSFVSREKEAYIREHEQILYKRYPLQMQKNAEHCRDNPNGWVGENIGMHFDIWNGRKNILYLLQSDFREGADDNVGGTQLHVKHLTYGLRDTMNIFVAARNGEYLCVTAYTKSKEYSFMFYIGQKELFPLLRNRELAEIFRTILEGFKIDLVHVHHTATTSLDIYYEADKLGIPVIFTMHDFYCVCPNEKLLDADGEVCIMKTADGCKECLKQRFGVCEENDYLHIWRTNYNAVLGICKKIILPSDSAKDIFLKYYSKYENKIKVIEHGMDLQPVLMVDETKLIDTDNLAWEIEKVNKKKTCSLFCGEVRWLNKLTKGKVILKITDKIGKVIYLPTTYGRNIDVLQDDNKFYLYIPNTLFPDGELSIEVILYKDNCYYMKKGKKETFFHIRYNPQKKFRVGFIGGLNEEKGGKIVYDIIKKGSSDIEWYVLGRIGENNLYQLKQKNLIKTGAYYQDDLSTWLKYYKIDVVCILSKWAETFSYTLSEAVVNHIPVIVTDIGALGQRTKKYGYGITVNIEDAVDEVINQIEEWRLKDDKYQDLRQHLKSGHKTIRHMANEYKDLYMQMGSKEVKNNVISLKEKEILYDALVENTDFDSDNKALMNKIKELKNYINRIEGSAAFKVMRKVYELNIPFKKEIRKMILKGS